LNKLKKVDKKVELMKWIETQQEKQCLGRPKKHKGLNVYRPGQVGRTVHFPKPIVYVEYLWIAINPVISFKLLEIKGNTFFNS